MFESITIKSKESSGLKIDIGFLAECLFFYQKVNLLGDKNTLPELFNFCGIDSVRELIKQGRLNLFVREDILGSSEFGNNRFDIQTWKSESIRQEKILVDTFSPLVDSNKKRDSLVKDFMDLTKPFKYNDGILEEIKSDLQDSEYITKAIANSINFWNPQNTISAEDIEYNYYEDGQFGPFTANKFETNIDFKNYSNVSPSGILLNVAEARGNIHIASHFESEIADKSIYSLLIQDRINTLIDKIENSKKDIANFQEIILSDYKPIGISILDKSIPFSELVKLLEKGEKFREWLSKVEEDNNLISEYYKAVTSDTWAEKLPSKGIRFAVFTGAGLVLDALLTGGIGTVAGIALGAGDTFVVDKLIKGWKPNQFIDEVENVLNKE